MRDDAGAFEAEQMWDGSAPKARRSAKHHGTVLQGRALSLRPVALLATVAAAALGMLVPMVYVGTAAAAAPGDECASVAGLAPDSLCVQSSTGGSTTAPYDSAVITRGKRITDFKWLVNADDTGDTSFNTAQVNACLPTSAVPTQADLVANPALSIYGGAGSGSFDNCGWPSMHAVSGHAGVIADGTGDPADVAKLGNLPDGKYLISVTAPGYKIDGVHFVVKHGAIDSVNEEAGKHFIVKMNPLPKKTATVRVHVFNDNASTNGQWDGQTETLITCADATTQQRIANCGGANSASANRVGDPSTDMSGFSIQINDVLNPVTTDVYGNPLCTQYFTDGNGNVVLNGDGQPTPIQFKDVVGIKEADGTVSTNSTLLQIPAAGGASGSMLNGTESSCISDHYGDIVIPNMGPNRYAATVIAPDPRSNNGKQWVQTTTLEGGHDWDTWNSEGGTGYDTELVVGGERVPPVAHGFVQLTHNDDYLARAKTAAKDGDSSLLTNYYDASGQFSGGPKGYGSLTGAIHIGRSYTASGGGVPLAGTNLANSTDGGVISDGLVSINCLADCNAPTDSAVWVGRTDDQGAFTVTGLQTGDYSVAFWDESQNYIMGILQYHVDGVPGAGNTIANLVGATVSRSTGPTLQFIADPGLKTNDWVMLSGGGRGWSGTFYVNGIVTKTTPKNGPTTWNVPVTAVLPTVDPRRGTTQLPSVARAGSAPAATDVKKVLLQGWFTDLQGAIFNDLDGNGKRDECPTAKVNCNPQYVENADGFFTEPGIPDFTVTVRTRGNSLVDQGAAVAKTNDEGSYDLGQAYPLGQFLIFEAYNPRFKNTGFTYQADNDHVEHTVLTSQVDYNFLPIIGLSGRIDVGVQAYGTGTDYWSGDGATPASKNENGGIVGTVSYDVTRNEFNPAYSLAEDYQPGVAGIPVQLWKPVIGTDGKPVLNGDGSLAQQGMSAAGVCTRLETLRGTNAVLDPTQTCKPFDYYVSEHWTRPTGCQALDLAGHPLTGEFVNPKVNVADDSHTSDKNGDCVESPMNGFQIGGDGSVDGNYALNSLIRATSLQQAPAGGQALADFYSAAQGNGDYSDPLTNADYVVEAVNPVDTVVGGNTTDPTTGGYHDASKLAPKRLYQFTDEVEVNVLTGDTYVPQEGFSCDAKCEQSPGYALQNTKTRQRNDVNSLGAGTVAQCVGANHLVDSSANPDFAAGGGSPFDGETTPICDAKLVKVVGGRSVNPNFYMYTQVPTPSKFFGLMNDDLNLNTDRRSVLFGEVAPVSNGPVGIYDENGNWKYTAHTDHNGFYEVILPSMDTYNCPLPAGPCPNVYRLVGNDPGTLAHRNLDYNPGFRTIATEFQAWTGVIHPVDQAPTHQGITIDTPGSQFSAFSLCQLAPNNPSLFRIDQPFFNPDKGAGHTYTVQGQGFGAAPKVMVAYLNNNGTNGTSYTVTPTSSSDTALSFQLPDAAKAVPGSWQVTVKNTDATSGMSTVNGITLHVLHSDTPDKVNGKNVVSNELRPQDLFFVTPDSATDLGIPTTNKDGSGNHLYTPMNDAWDPFTDTAAGFAGTSKYGDGVSGGRAVQRAIEAAHQAAYENVSDPKSPELGHAKLVVVYPNTAENYASHNAFASYFENLIVHGNVMLQGVGPGGATTSSNIVEGTSIDASTFWSATQATPAGGNPQTSDGNYQDDWRAFANRLPIDSNNPDIPEGQSVLALAESGSQYANSTHSFKAGVDGFQLTGGDQMGTPTNINTAPGVVGGDTVTAAPTPGPAQGGAITLDQHITWFAISNNLIQGNGGTFGTIRIGTPDLPIANNHNENLKVANNRVIANSGTNLAGGLGIFNGADNYTVTGNDFCGNFSAEYGGAIGHYGQSGGGTINKNRIYYNQSYDEGGGIMIAGELPANNNVASVGAGRSSGGVGVGVTIDSNLLLANLANDDGGGVRFLSAGNFPFLVQNNIIANNVSTHEGGGISLDDAPNVSVVNNTVVKNITTGTAVSNGAIGDIKPANPAGLSTAMNTSNFQKTLGKSALVWSKPTLLNNIFSDNRAGWATLPTDPNATALHGIGDPGDPVGIQRWDIGAVGVPGAVFDGASNFTNSRDTLGLTNAVASSTAYVATDNLTAGADGTVGMGFKSTKNFVIDSVNWRVNPTVGFATIVTQLLPVNLIADYHVDPLANPVSPAFNSGVSQYGSSSGQVFAPNHDIDGEARPALGSFDRGADEIPGKTVDVKVTKTDGVTSVKLGDALKYTITVTNINGPDPVVAATLSDTVPSQLGSVSWSCAGTGGANCTTTPTAGSPISTGINVPVGGVLAVTVNATVTATSGSFANAATVTLPIDETNSNGVLDLTGTDQLDTVFVPPPPIPTLGLLDNFNRANSLGLGSNWNVTTAIGIPTLGVNTNQAAGGLVNGVGYWNGAVPNTGPVFGVKQGAAFTITTSTSNNDALMLKVSGATNSSGVAANFIRVLYSGGNITVGYTTNNGGAFVTTAKPATVANGSTLTAVANTDGSVDVWVTTAANVTTYIGNFTTALASTAPFTGTGRIGLQVAAFARVDNFAGGTL